MFKLNCYHAKTYVALLQLPMYYFLVLSINVVTTKRGREKFKSEILDYFQVWRIGEAEGGAKKFGKFGSFMDNPLLWLHGLLGWRSLPDFSHTRFKGGTRREFLQ